MGMFIKSILYHQVYSSININKAIVTNYCYRLNLVQIVADGFAASTNLHHFAWRTAESIIVI